MNTKTANHTNGAHKAPREPIATKERLCKDVESILARCLHLFEEDMSFASDGHFDVDAVVQGREHVRIISERRHSPPPQKRIRSDSYAPLTKPNRGSFIPHHELRHA